MRLSVGFSLCITKLSLSAVDMYRWWQQPVMISHNDSDAHCLEYYWSDHFLHRHTDVASWMARNINRECTLANNEERIQTFYSRLQEVRSRFHIKAEDIWNFDEKGFSIGQSDTRKVFCRANRRNPSLVQEGGRDWVTVFKTVSATTRSISLLIVYNASA